MAFHLGTSEPRPVGLAAREKQLGHTYTHYHDYMGGGFGAWTPKHPDRVNLVTFSSGDVHNGVKTFVQDCLAGKLDSAIHATATSFASYGKPVYAGVWQESNGGWMSTNAKYIGGVSNYIKAWRHVASIIKPAAPNARMVFCPNVKTYAGVEDPGLYYPGDDVVDAVYVDGYCKNGYKTPAYIFASAYKQFGPGSTHNKPFGIAETAAAKDSSPEKYIPALASWLGANTVEAVYWFDNEWAPSYYNVDATAAELTAYKAFAAKAA
jgi:hypothetical protein